MRRVVLLVGVLAAVTVAGPVSAATPTCSDVEFLAIQVYGQHVVRDYVTGGSLSGWPPKGQVGAAIAGEGAATPGGPGPGFHFDIGAAPGASFCNSQSQSPGFHL